MNRREFARVGLAAGTVSLLRASEASAGMAATPPAPFTLKYAPHFGQFEKHAGPDLLDQLRFAADQGFRAFEDNEMTRRPADTQEKIGREMTRLGLTMGVFVANFGTAFGKPTFTTGEAQYRESFLADLKQSVEVAKRVNAKWVTVVPGEVHPRLDAGYQTANVIEMLKRGAAVLEPHGLVMVLEALNTRHDHPGLFLNTIAQGYALCKAVGSPAVKILYDCYHQQITEGNLIPNFDAAWDEIGYVQIGDNPGRNEPGTGEVNWKNVFRHLSRKGFQGVLGMEHGMSGQGKDGEAAVIAAYRGADGF